MTDTMMALKRYGLKKSDFRIVKLQNAKAGTMGYTQVTWNGKTYEFGGCSCGRSTASVSVNTRMQYEWSIDSFLSMVNAIR